MHDLTFCRTKGPLEVQDKRAYLPTSHREEDDTRTVELLSTAGEASHPPADSRVFSVTLEGGVSLTLAIDDGIVNDLKEGEKRIYSTKDGAIEAQVHLSQEGELTLNEGSDYAVRFEKLKKALEARFDAIHTAFTNVAKAVTEVVAKKPPVDPLTAATTTLSSAKTQWSSDIDSAKAEKIKL